MKKTLKSDLLKGLFHNTQLNSCKAHSLIILSHYLIYGFYVLLRSVVVELSSSSNCFGVYQEEDLLLFCFHFLPYCCYAILFLFSPVIVTNPQVLTQHPQAFITRQYREGRLCLVEKVRR